MRILLLVIVAVSASANECDRPCPRNAAPVCSSDGRTLPNACEFDNYRCAMELRGVAIEVAHEGACEIERGPVCELRPCPRNLAPVCASDDVTFPNQCEFENHRCQMRQKGIEVKKRKDGRCEDVKCQIEACPRNLDPVCSSDGKTLPNVCEFHNHACRHLMAGEGAVTIIKRGPCEDVGECEVPSACPEIYRPVCGSDGRTYPSACVLQAASCRARRGDDAGIDLISEGPCDECERRCPTERQHVCGTDGRSYANVCRLRVASCESRRRGGPDIGVRSRDGTGCGGEREGEGGADCERDCDRKIEPVCSSDGKTFRNKCRFQVYRCRMEADGIEIQMAQEGLC